MYGNCGALEDAFALFDKLHERDEFSWNFMITACARYGRRKEALQHFEQMQCEASVPNRFIFASLLSACAIPAILSEGRRIHTRVFNTCIQTDVSVGNAVVNMYGKCGNLENARNLFDQMPERDTLSWTAMIAAYAQHGKGKESLRLFKRMQRLSGLESDIAVGNALINMYSKCGRLKNAELMFEKLRGRRDLVSWTAMIAAYAQHGRAKTALQLFRQMRQEGVMPDEVTFISVLSACSHAGLIREGYHWLVSMNRDYGISPIVDHYNCMIDLFGRVGRVEEAEDLLKRMPVPSSLVSWMTLLSACRNLNDVERGEHAAQHVFRLDPEDSAPYVMLSNIYAEAGRLDDAAKIIDRMKELGLKKPPGISSIEVKGRLHEFIVDDQSHPQKAKIYAELERLNSQMVESGYVLNRNCTLHSLEEGDKYSNHSEKLAIVFGLINTPPRTPLLITKNLRVCLDCHSAIKFISKLTSREIIVRDAHRFHHIQDGICSCADYW